MLLIHTLLNHLLRYVANHDCEVMHQVVLRDCWEQWLPIIDLCDHAAKTPHIDWIAVFRSI